MNRRYSTPIRRSALLAIAFAGLCSCVTQGIPTHGGGKRFFYEQALIAKAVDSAIEQLDLDAIVDPESGEVSPVNLYVVAMGDAGGGSESSSGGIGIFGVRGTRSGAAAAGGNVPAGGMGASATSSHAFANARDIEFVRGRFVQALSRRGIPIEGLTTEGAESSVYVVMSELGTSKEGFNLLVYREVTLSARAAMEAIYIPKPARSGDSNPAVSLGAGECTTTYEAKYLFGAGPLQGRKIHIAPGPIPAEIIWTTDEVEEMEEEEPMEDYSEPELIEDVEDVDTPDSL